MIFQRLWRWSSENTKLLPILEFNNCSNFLPAAFFSSVFFVSKFLISEFDEVFFLLFSLGGPQTQRRRLRLSPAGENLNF